MITLPSTVRLTLIPDASLSRSPVAPLCRCRSLPGVQAASHRSTDAPSKACVAFGEGTGEFLNVRLH